MQVQQTSSKWNKLISSCTLVPSLIHLPVSFLTLRRLLLLRSTWCQYFFVYTTCHFSVATQFPVLYVLPIKVSCTCTSQNATWGNFRITTSKLLCTFQMVIFFFATFLFSFERNQLKIYQNFYFSYNIQVCVRSFFFLP